MEVDTSVTRAYGSQMWWDGGMTEHPPFTDHWLDEVEGARALAWVEEQNSMARQRLVHGDFAEIEGTIREILDDDRKIPLVTERGGLLYNF